MEFEQSDPHPKAEAISGLPNEFSLWSSGQKAACEQLLEVAETFFDLRWESLGAMRPRLDTLVVGPTGMGKSHLVRVVSRKLGIPILRLSFGEWLVTGSRETPRTLDRVHAFVDEHPVGIIHIDELDKIRSTLTSDWSTSILVELFLLLDRSLQQPTRTYIWTEHLQKKLQRSFLMVGCGTWQSMWAERNKRPIGFHPSTGSSHGLVQREIANRSVIPDELLRRFSSRLIILPPPTEEDYREGAKAFGLDRMAKDLGVCIDYTEATEGGLGARWLEEKLGDLLRLAKRTGKSLFPAAETPPPEPSDLDVEDDPSYEEPF